jgi:hypothetical protein
MSNSGATYVNQKLDPLRANPPLPNTQNLSLTDRNEYLKASLTKALEIATKQSIERVLQDFFPM